MTVLEETWAGVTDNTAVSTGTESDIDWVSLSNDLRGAGTGTGFLKTSTTTSVCNIRTAASVDSSDCYSKLLAKVIDTDASGNAQVAPVVRVPDSANTGTGYLMQMDGRPNDASEVIVTLRKQVNNSRTNLSSPVTKTHTIQTVAELEVRAEGSTITGYWQGAQEFQVTDTEHTTGMRGGIYMFNNGAWVVQCGTFEAGALSDLNPPPSSPWSVIDGGVDVPMECLGVVDGGVLVPLILEHP